MTSSDRTSGARDTAWAEQDHAKVRDRVRSAARLSGVDVEEFHGHLGFTVRGRWFAWLLVDHHGDGRLALVLKAPPGDQEALVGNRHGYFIPFYLGSKGWIGIELTPARNLTGASSLLIQQAWRMTASKTAIADWEKAPRP